MKPKPNTKILYTPAGRMTWDGGHSMWLTREQTLEFIVSVLNRKEYGNVEGELSHGLMLLLENQPQHRETIAAKLKVELLAEPSLIDYVGIAMKETLRDFADMWIDSGKDSARPDYDDPMKRNVIDVLPGRQRSLFYYLDRFYLRKTRVRRRMRRDGTCAIEILTPEFPGLFLTFKTLTKCLYEAGEMWAGHHFCNLLDSRYSHHLSRCDKCKTYFTYQRTRIRAVKHGVFCFKCKSASAVKRRDRSRENERAVLFETAAQAWVEWESKRRRLGQKQWVADEVNKRHGATYGARWIAQNLQEIQKRVEAQRRK